MESNQTKNSKVQIQPLASNTEKPAGLHPLIAKDIGASSKGGYWQKKQDGLRIAHAHSIKSEILNALNGK